MWPRSSGQKGNRAPFSCSTALNASEENIETACNGGFHGIFNFTLSDRRPRRSCARAHTHTHTQHCIYVWPFHVRMEQRTRLTHQAWFATRRPRPCGVTHANTMCYRQCSSLDLRQCEIKLAQWRPCPSSISLGNMQLVYSTSNRDYMSYFWLL